jgi:hypothetical protein
MHWVMSPGVHWIASANPEEGTSHSFMKGKGLKALESKFRTGGMKAAPGVGTKDYLLNWGNETIGPYANQKWKR